jgi:hypothetical protein
VKVEERSDEATKRRREGSGKVMELKKIGMGIAIDWIAITELLLKWN